MNVYVVSICVNMFARVSQTAFMQGSAAMAPPTVFREGKDRSAEHDLRQFPQPEATKITTAPKVTFLSLWLLLATLYCHFYIHCCSYCAYALAEQQHTGDRNHDRTGVCVCVCVCVQQNERETKKGSSHPAVGVACVNFLQDPHRTTACVATGECLGRLPDTREERSDLSWQ